MHTSARSALIGGAVMVAIATSFALGRGPVHQLRDKPFQDWREDIGAMAMMSARLEALNMPKLVQTESIMPIERDPLMVALAEPMAGVSPGKRKAAVVAGDICARHNLRKVYDGPRWRCRR